MIWLGICSFFNYTFCKLIKVFNLRFWLNNQVFIVFFYHAAIISHYGNLWEIKSKLTHYQNLRHLAILQHNANNITPLSNLTNLRSLLLFETENIKDIAPLSELINLEQLNISGLQMVDLSPLAELNNLKYLFLSQANLSNIEPLKELINLQNLYIEGTITGDISSLKKLVNLQELTLYDRQNISDQQIEDLQKALPNLKIEW